MNRRANAPLTWRALAAAQPRSEWIGAAVFMIAFPIVILSLALVTP